ncbi:helix-turn-helix domain-containing protein [Microbacterium sp. AGC85]
MRAAAMELFRANGLETPLERIAERAGVTKGTIYHRFGSRQGLIDDVIDQLASFADRVSADTPSGMAVAFVSRATTSNERRTTFYTRRSRITDRHKFVDESLHERT